MHFPIVLLFLCRRYWILPKEGTTEDTGSSSETESSDQTQKKVPQVSGNISSFSLGLIYKKAIFIRHWKDFLYLYKVFRKSNLKIIIYFLIIILIKEWMFTGVLMLCKKRSLVLIIINFINALTFAIFMYIVVYKGML